MAEAQAKVRMTLDGQQFNQQADRMAQRIKGAADASAKIGQHIEQLPIAMAKTALSAGLVVSTLRSAVSLITEYYDIAEKNARTRGAGKAKLFAEQQRAGVPENQMQQIQSMVTAGEISYEDAAGVMAKAREAKIRDPQAIVRAVRAKSLGIFADEEIINERRRSVISAEDITARAERTPGAVVAERNRLRNERLGEQFPYNEGLATFRSDVERIKQTETFGERFMRMIGMGNMDPIIKSAGRNLVQRVEVVNPKPVTGARGEGSK